jgi:hypothetical protein
LNPRCFGSFTFIFVAFGESCLLVSWCAIDRCDMAGSDDNRGRSRRSSAKDQRWSSTGQVLSGQTIGGSGDTLCGQYRANGDEEREFFG